MIWELANGEEKWPQLRQHTFVFVVSCPFGITSSQVSSEIKIDNMFLLKPELSMPTPCLVTLSELIVDHHHNMYHHHRHRRINHHPHRGNVKDWLKDREQRVVGDHSRLVQALKHLFKSLHGHLRSSGGRVLMFPLQFVNRWIIVDRNRPGLPYWPPFTPISFHYIQGELSQFLLLILSRQGQC